MIREDYITDTCASDFKDVDGEILHMTSNVDKTCDDDLLCDEDKSVKVIIDEDMENSDDILLDSQYYLINCGRI